MSKFYDSERVCNDEEFNNFLIKVNEVNNIVKRMASKDKEVAAAGDLEAKRYLNENSEPFMTNIDEEVVLEVKSNRTLINKKALETEKNDNPNSMSQEAFMREIERDADKRYKDKLIRTEKMETFKKRATLAFRRGEFEQALTLYNKAIEQIKDSVLLYNNRALTFIILNLYEKAEKDLDLALRLNEDCLKSWLLLAKVHFAQKNKKKYNEDVKEALRRNPEQVDFIKEYIKKIEEDLNKQA